MKILQDTLLSYYEPTYNYYEPTIGTKSKRERERERVALISSVAHLE
jgi:hypothetical protein